LDVLPALLVSRPRDVGVSELVDERDLRTPGDHHVDVHLLELGAAVADQLARDDLEIADLFRGPGPAVRLHEPDDDVGAAIVPPAALVQHRERLPDAGRGAEIDPKITPGHR